MIARNVGGVTALDAWRQGVQAILSEGEAFNLFTTVDQPTFFDPAWVNTYSPRKMGVGRDDLREVIKTIFPYDLANRLPDRPELYREYLRSHDRAMRFVRNRGKWGTYFERLVRFPNHPETNQLETVISKLRTWPTRGGTSLVFHLSAPSCDSPRTRGGPCWQFGEIVWHRGDLLDFVVVYRNHDFLNKALGNFIGLGQLLKFICNASGKTPGRLLCHSVHAYNSGTKNVLRALSD
jgi:thymidylate synthase